MLLVLAEDLWWVGDMGRSGIRDIVGLIDRLEMDGDVESLSIYTLGPDYRALLIAVDGIKPGPSDSIMTELPHIKAWRNTYKAFGAKPQKTRNSLEALTRRAEAGLPRVNRLTDIYNAISVKHQIPLGGEDLNKYVGPPRLISATGVEDFETSIGGEVVVEHPDFGEVVWCDDAGVTCRRWNWRQGPRTALTDATTSALFILDVLEPVSESVLAAAADELASALRKSSPELPVVQRVLHGPERS
ncbi:hypothetical protein LTR37_011561 [Vermiconidia calcicola]|uniref:Uncharacterized protein n=1 Tax=Vermiconidia calcicola TaxID=1690605 RepID=A0ACC3N361_9PEZI|nr:hypothetical protein LTR37_011561 [Vermiconidia calcicola]